MDLRTKPILHTDGKLKIFIESYLNSKPLSKGTRQRYAYVLRMWSDAMPDDISDLTLEHIESWLMDMQGQRDESTMDLYIRILKTFSTYLSQFGYINWGYRLEHRCTVNYNQRILSRLEYDKVCSVAIGRELDCFKFLCMTGLRVSEFVGLQPSSINNGFVHVSRNVKRKKYRGVPLNKTAKEIVTRDPLLSFIKYRSRNSVNNLCKRLAKRAQVPHFHPHSGRHFYANELYHKGIKVEIISLLLGHADVNTTLKIYVHWKLENLIGSTDCLDD